MLPLRAHRRGGHLHVLVLERALGPEAELDLVRERNLERVALERRAELARSRLDRSEVAAMPTRRGLGEGAGLLGSGRRSLGAQAPVAGEAPGPVHEDANADPLGLGVVEPLDPLVARPDNLGAAHDHASIGVAGPRTESRGHSLLTQLPHDAYLKCARPARELRSYNPPRALVAELVDAQG